MKKTLAAIGATSAFAVAGLGLASVASAQTADSTDEDGATTESTESTESTTDEERSTDGRRGNGERSSRSGEGRGGCGGNEAVAELLGLEVDELRAMLDEGATLADIAEANDVDPDELVDLMVANATERLDEKVAEGRLTDEEAAEKLAERAERIEDKIFGEDDDDAEADDDAADADDDEVVEGEGS